MTITSIAPIESIAATQGVSASDAATSIGSGFGKMFDGAVSDLNQKLATAETGLQQLAAGKATNLHEVMINVEQAKLQLQLVMQIRSRVLEAYQDLMRTQV